MVSYEQGQRDAVQMNIQLFMPAGSAFRTGRFIAGGGFVGLARLPLGVEGIEILLKPLLGRDARIDGATQAACGEWRAHPPYRLW